MAAANAHDLALIVVLILSVLLVVRSTPVAQLSSWGLAHL
jgi:hypothetical protein